MQTPNFWSESGLVPTILTPLSAIYEFLSVINQITVKPVKIPKPVICVGNITAGGAGKTPTAIAIAQYLLSRNLRPHFLSRGYGGSSSGPLQVSTSHDVHLVGDEPIHLAEIAPTWVSRNRVAGAMAAVEKNADLIIMDDGYQNPSIAKDLSLLVIDAGFGFGNGRIIPSGPLRERPIQATKRADAIIVISDPTINVKDDFLQYGKPTYSARLVPSFISDKFNNSKIVAFCGIGRPEKFFSMITSIGAHVASTHAFPDHHIYTVDEIMQIVEEAVSLEATPVTTKKDWKSLPP